MRNRAHLLPAVLIAIGLVALLVDVGGIPTDRLYRLPDLWPALLIVLGLEIFISRARLPAAAETAASLLVVVLAVAGAGVYVALGPPISTATRTMTTVVPAGGITQATLEIDVGASTLHVQGSTSSADDLLHSDIKYVGPPPSVDVDGSSGRVTIKQNDRFGYFGPQSFDGSIELNASISWRLVIHSGASQDTYDLTNLQLSAMEVDTGASTENIMLPAPHGMVPVRINGGALTVHLHRPAGSAAAVKVSGGAVSLTFDGDQSTAVGGVGHSTAQAADMFDVNVDGGTCTVTMDSASGLD